MDYFLQKVGGRPARQTVTLRRCTPAEAPAVFALQNEVRAAMPHPEQFVPDTLENIADYLRTGVCIGAWQQGRLGAYLILRLCGQSDENYAAFLGVPQSQWQHWANADSAVVHPDWRGNGLQRKLLEAALRNMKYLNIKILGFVMTRGSVDKSGYGKRYGKYKKGYGGYYSYGAPPAGDRRPSEPKQTGGKKSS